MMIELRLSAELEPDPQGRVLLQRVSDKLHAWYFNEAGERLHFNPFAFGAFFSVRGLKSSDLTVLSDFLQEASSIRDPYDLDFPKYQQLEIMKYYLREEHNLELDESKLLILCELYHQLYPIFWRYAVTSGTCILYDGFYGRYLSESYLPYQSSTSYEELIKLVFGQARKDTLREGRNIDAMGFSLAYVFRDLLPLDVIVHELSNLEGSFGEFPLDPAPYGALARLSQPIRRRLFCDLILNYKLDAIEISDALELLSEIHESQLKRLKGVTSWDELHRRLMSYSDAVEGTIAIAVPPSLNELRGDLSGYEFRPLTRAEEFALVGEWLEICIGKAGYYKKAVHGESYCLVGFKGEQPQAALEVKHLENGWRVQQLRGPQNSKLPEQGNLTQLIEDRLNRKAA